MDKLFLPLIQWYTGKCKSIEDYNMTKDADGNPTIADCQENFFADYFSTKEAMALYGSFYTNHNGITDKFLAFWDIVTKRLSANQYVIGFDPINEPQPSNYVKEPKLVRPHVFDK